MCTLSVLRRPEAVDAGEAPLWRVSFNRDERRTRPPAIPPHQHIYDDRAAIHPIDPLGGGTWIAVSAAGLVFALLNGYSEGDRRTRAVKSRGLIIPTLVSADTLDVAATRVRHDGGGFATHVRMTYRPLETDLSAGAMPSTVDIARQRR